MFINHNDGLSFCTNYIATANKCKDRKSIAIKINPNLLAINDEDTQADPGTSREKRIAPTVRRSNSVNVRLNAQISCQNPWQGIFNMLQFPETIFQPSTKEETSGLKE